MGQVLSWSLTYYRPVQSHVYSIQHFLTYMYTGINPCIMSECSIHVHVYVHPVYTCTCVYISVRVTRHSVVCFYMCLYTHTIYQHLSCLAPVHGQESCNMCIRLRGLAVLANDHQLTFPASMRTSHLSLLQKGTTQLYIHVHVRMYMYMCIAFAWVTYRGVGCSVIT